MLEIINNSNDPFLIWLTVSVTTEISRRIFPAVAKPPGSGSKQEPEYG